MDIEQIKDWIVFEAVSGSHAYGTNVQGSDTDIRGVFILPTKEVLAGRYIPQVSDKKNDITYYEIGRFIELAAKGNPNILEMLNMPKDCILKETKEWRKYFPKEMRDKFITSKLKHTFTGYAYSQIKKARGLNKKINWDKSKVERKDVLDFCYVIDRERSEKFRDWNLMRFTHGQIPGTFKPASKSDIGLAKVNNAPDLYSMYLLSEGGGIVGPNSNDVQVRNIPKGSDFIGYLRFDRNAYSTHCKDYREYQEWVENRNPERYKDNLKGEQGYDHKNMMHCMRLLNMARDIAEGKGIVVRRPEARELLKIRNGEMKYEDLLDNAEKMVEDIKGLFDKAGLPHGVKPKLRQDLLLKIRKDGCRRIYQELE